MQIYGAVPTMPTIQINNPFHNWLSKSWFTSFQFGLCWDQLYFDVVKWFPVTWIRKQIIPWSCEILSTNIVPYAIFGTPSVFPFNPMLNRYHENAVGSLNFLNQILKLFKKLDQITSYLSDILKIYCFMANSLIRRVRYLGTPDFFPIKPHVKVCSFKQFLKLIKIVWSRSNNFERKLWKQAHTVKKIKQNPERRFWHSIF